MQALPSSTQFNFDDIVLPKNEYDIINLINYQGSKTIESSCSDFQRASSILLAIATCGLALCFSTEVRNAAIYGKNVITHLKPLDLSEKQTADAVHKLAKQSIANHIAKPNVCLTDLNYRCREILKFYERKDAGLHDEPDLGTDENISELQTLLKNSNTRYNSEAIALIKQIDRYKVKFSDANRQPPVIPRFTDSKDEETYIITTQDLEKLKLYILSRAQDPNHAKQLLLKAQAEGYPKKLTGHALWSSSAFREINNWNSWVGRHFPTRD